MQASFGLLPPGAALCHPLFDRVSPQGRSRAARWACKPSRPRPAPAGARIRTARPAAAPAPPPQVLRQDATPTSSADEADLIKRVAIKSPL